MTVLNPDICPSERREDAVGTVLLAHAVVTDAKGSPWVALVTGEATQLCRWVAVSGCFETLPCDCRRMAQQNYRPTLRLFRAPNFSTPVAELPLAEARNIALSADSAGNRAGVLLADPDRYDQNARLLIFDLDGG